MHGKRPRRRTDCVLGPGYSGAASTAWTVTSPRRPSSTCRLALFLGARKVSALQSWPFLGFGHYEGRAGVKIVDRARAHYGFLCTKYEYGHAGAVQCLSRHPIEVDSYLFLRRRMSHSPSSRAVYMAWASFGRARRVPPQASTADGGVGGGKVLPQPFDPGATAVRRRTGPPPYLLPARTVAAHTLLLVYGGGGPALAKFPCGSP